MLQIAVPSVLQQSIDMMIVQAVVNPFGTQALAGYAATMRVELAVRQAGLQTSWFPMGHSENPGQRRRWSCLDKFGIAEHVESTVLLQRRGADPAH